MSYPSRRKNSTIAYHNRFTLSTNYPSSNSALSEWISQAEAARLRGVTRQAIAKLVKAGRLRTLAASGRLLVHRADVLTFEPHPAGRPSKDTDRHA